MTSSVERHIKRLGTGLIVVIEHIGLLIVLGTVLIAAVQEITNMYRSGQVAVTDLLLLFIYLELITMSSVYWRVGRLPVRMPLYIAMVAMSRHLTLDAKDVSPMTMLAEAGAILLLAIAVLAVRYGHIRLPYTDEGGPGRLS